MSVSAPHTPRAQVMIRIIVREGTKPGEGDVIHDKTNDHNEPFFRDWIMDTEWWALRNGKNVVKYPV